jgi:hypothetical protein
MRTLTSTQLTATSARITTPAYLVELGFGTVLRLSTRNDQTWGGYTWVGGRLGKVSGLQWDGQGAQRGNLEIINTDLAFSALILNEGAADRSCRIWAFYGDNPADAQPVFDGVMDEADISPDRVRLSLVGENTRTLYSPRRFIGAGTGFNRLRPAGTKITWGGQTYILERAL